MTFRLRVGAACLLAALLAWHRHATVLSEPGGRFEDPDAMFHARRAMRVVAQGTLLPPVFDAFENFPGGGQALWPPLHDATLALLARAGGSTRSEPDRGMTTAAALPVAELILVVLLAAAVARRSGGGPIGATVAAFTVALSAPLVRRAAFGEIDHNLTEVLFGLAMLHYVSTRVSSSERELRGEAGTRGELQATGRGRRELYGRLAWAAGWAALVLVSLGFYTGLVLSAGIVGAAACAAALADEDDGGARRALPSLALGFAIAAPALPFFAGLRVRPVASDPWRLGPVYSLLLSAAATGMALGSLSFSLRRSSAANREEGAKPRWDVVTLAALLLAAAAAAAQPRAAWGALARGIGFVGARDPWLATIDEFRPIFSSKLALIGTIPALPVAAVTLFLAARAWRRLERPRRAALVLVALPAVLLLVLAVLQKRFLPPASAFLAAAAGAAWTADSSPAAVWTRRIVLAAGTLVMLQAFGLTYLGETFRNESAPLVSAGEAAGNVVHDATPPPGDPPAWGVLAPWEYGHEILRYSGRAVALNNFGSMQPGFGRAMAIFLETDPTRAVAELDALRLRYLLAAYPPNVIPGGAKALGLDPARYFAGGWNPDRLTPYQPTAEGARTFLVRLHLAGGAPSPDDAAPARAALARLALLWDSPQTGPGPAGRPVPFMRLFELKPSP